MNLVDLFIAQACFLIIRFYRIVTGSLRTNQEGPIFPNALMREELFLPSQILKCLPVSLSGTFQMACFHTGLEP